MVDWYYGTEGEQKGPINGEEMRQRIINGEIRDETLVWRDGMINWSPKSSVLELQNTSYPIAAQGYATGMYPVAPNSGLAIASMVCGIVSVLSCAIYLSGICAIPAIICGHMALNRIANSPVPVAGRGMAIAGLVTGYLGLLCQVAVIVGAIYLFTNLSTM